MSDHSFLMLRCRFRGDVLDRTACRPDGAAVRAVMLTGLGAWWCLPLVNAALRPDVPTFLLAEETCRLLDFVAGSHRRPFFGVVSNDGCSFTARSAGVILGGGSEPEGTPTPTACHGEPLWSWLLLTDATSAHALAVDLAHHPHGISETPNS